MTENEYQRRLIKKLRELFPGCLIVKNDSGYQQGIPDLTVLYGPYWALLEVKASEFSKERPNQRHYVGKLDEMSFAAFIYPENEAEVLVALQQAFAVPGSSRVS